MIDFWRKAGHWLKPLAQRIPRGWTVIDRVSPTQLKLKVDLRPARLGVDLHYGVIGVRFISPL